MKATIISLIVTGIFTAAGYGVLLAADGRYVTQDTWIAESRAHERRELLRRIDELEFEKSARSLTPTEAWRLRRLKTELRELK